MTFFTKFVMPVIWIFVGMFLTIVFQPKLEKLLAPPDLIIESAIYGIFDENLNAFVTGGKCIGYRGVEYEINSTCKLTDKFKKQCEGQHECEVIFGNKDCPLGDPAQGCEKLLKVDYKCDQEFVPMKLESEYAKKATLSC